ADGTALGANVSLGQVYAGTYLVSVDGLTGALATDEAARIDDALNELNSTLSSFGVILAKYDETTAATPDVQVHLASTSAIGGMDQGILGVTTLGGQITIITTWNWYTGANGSAIGA